MFLAQLQMSSSPLFLTHVITLPKLASRARWVQTGTVWRYVQVRLALKVAVSYPEGTLGRMIPAP